MPAEVHLICMKIHPTEALKAVRDLIAAAEKADDIKVVLPSEGHGSDDFQGFACG